MTLWWPNAFPDKPWRTWFWARRPGEDDAGRKFSEWPPGYYWFYKIPPEAGHKQQLAFKSPEDRRCYAWKSFNCDIKANVIYIITYPGDTPNWGNSTLVNIGPPCGNWHSSMYKVIPLEKNIEQSSHITAAVRQTRVATSKITAVVHEAPRVLRSQFSQITSFIKGVREKKSRLLAYVVIPPTAIRNQTAGIKTAIRTDQGSRSRIRSAIAKTFIMNTNVITAVRTSRVVSSKTITAIQTNRDRSTNIRSAVRTLREVECTLVSAIGKDFDLESKVTATVQGNPIKAVRYRGALKGEAQTTSQITAFVVLSRAEKIMLEMENLYPQEFDMRSVPNWASEFKDWRKSKLQEIL